MTIKMRIKRVGCSWLDTEELEVESVAKAIPLVQALGLTFTTVKCVPKRGRNPFNVAWLMSNEYANGERSAHVKLRKEDNGTFDNDELYQLETELSGWVERGFNGEIRSWYQRI
tara:strand:+ start:152 stop:493 length:342 start_codon:yes stop_codon:yes gene_type:complete